MNFDEYQTQDFLLDESFLNYVKGTNKEDSEKWEQWLEGNPVNQQEAKEAINTINSMSFKNKGFNQVEKAAIWDEIKQVTVESETEPKNNQLTKGFFSSYFMKVAAVLIPFILGAGLYLYYYGSSLDEGVITEKIVKEIPRGQKLTVYLSDGSMVKLNSESKISYVQPFDEDHRTVVLEGEAFFEVTHNPDRPFKVIAKGIETKVLGTSFNISAYADENHVDVSVVTGRVSVEKIPPTDKGGTNTKEPIVLTPSQQMSYFEHTEESVVTTFNAKKTLSWKNGTLYFNNATMEEFVEELERWYGIDIEVQRKIPIKKGIVGEFKDQSLEEILIGMHAASEFEYEFENGKLLIK